MRCDPKKAGHRGAYPSDFQWGGGWGYQQDADANLGLTLMGQRYYDPEVGRFITEDPIGFAGGLNLYAYCGGNPVGRVDPSGLHCEPFDDGANDIAGIADSYMAAMNRVRSRGAGLIGENLTTGFALAPGGNAAEWGKAAALASGGDWAGAGKTLAITYGPGLVVGGVGKVASKAPGGSLPELVFDYAKHRDLADNIWHAQQAGHPAVLTRGAGGNRDAALQLPDGSEIPRFPGTGRDEYPFNVTAEGGAGAWVGHVPTDQHRMQGLAIANFFRTHNIPVGGKFRVRVINHPGAP